MNDAKVDPGGGGGGLVVRTMWAKDRGWGVGSTGGGNP